MLRNPTYGLWRLFAGRPDIQTPGRYIWAPEGTPAYPGLHWLGSDIWTSDEYLDDPGLGIVRDGTYRRWKGDGPARHPPAVRLGDADCILNGERPGRVSLALVDGFDARCWRHFPVPPGPNVLYIDVRQPEYQSQFATILAYLYTDPDRAGQLLQQLLGPGSVVTIVPNSASTLPGYLIGVQGNTTVVVVSGTSNPQQFALQGLLMFAGPRDQGGYSTVPLWQAAANNVQAGVRGSTADQTGPVFLIGHSYGGATATILAAQYVRNQPDRPVQLLTFGSPLPGDGRLVGILRDTPQVNFVNAGDPVTAVPPTGRVATGLQALIPPGILLGWEQWAYPSARVGLAADGTRTDSPDPSDAINLVAGIVADTLAGREVATITAHAIEAYAARVGGTSPEFKEVLTGAILAWPVGTTPAGYLRCDGSAVSRATYSNLFAVVGTVWGVGDGSTTFNLPDLRGRSLIGDGTGTGLSARVVGQLGGEEAHQLTKPELTTHKHGISDPGHYHQVPNDTVGAAAGSDLTVWSGLAPATRPPPPTRDSLPSVTDIATNDEGGGEAFGIMGPFAVVRWVIKT